MNLLTVDKVSKSYTDKILFDKISFGIQEKDKIGVIGINGTGKSTLLKIVAGLEETSEGNVIKGNHVRIAYLPQIPEFDDSLSLLENVVSGLNQHNLGWNPLGEAKAMLGKLGILEFDRKPSAFSGGQRKRAALVRTLLTPADILVLDEPTNHLDNEMAEWLGAYLKSFQGAFIMITHDRYFLDEVSNRIVELDKGKLYTYETNYSGFLRRKAEREEMELATERKKQSLYRQDLEWMMRGARARSTKQKAHIQRFLELKDREKPMETKTVEMGSVTSRLGKKTIELQNICKSYGERQVIENFTYIFLKNDRIGIVGKNGCGKTTLLNIICGMSEPDTGSVEIGPTVKIGYFSQETQQMDPEQKVIDYIKEVGEYIETGEGRITASKMLERFLFEGSLQYSKIGKLSGGERRRLYLLRILMGAPNVLILDEPTNDLDIQTLTILEHYLDRFDGIVITVSHDRYFLDRVVTRIFAFEEDGVLVQYEGGYTDYRNAVGEKEPKEDKIVEKKEKTAKENWGKAREKKLKFTYKEQKEYESIDEVIETLEQRIAKTDAEILKCTSDYVQLNELSQKKEELEQQLEEATERWVYLNELAEQIEAAKKS